MKLSDTIQAVIDEDRKVEDVMLRAWVAEVRDLEEARVGDAKCCLRLVGRIAIDWWRARRK